MGLQVGLELGLGLGLGVRDRKRSVVGYNGICRASLLRQCEIRNFQSDSLIHGQH